MADRQGLAEHSPEAEPVVIAVYESTDYVRFELDDGEAIGFSLDSLSRVLSREE